MASSSWSLELPDGRHLVEADYGYWSGRATIRVDGRVTSRSNELLKMAFNWGVDIPFFIDRHEAAISIRPIIRGLIVVTGYSLGISVDGTSAVGTEPVDPIPDAKRRTGPRLVEFVAWASAGGAVLGLSQRGANPTAFVYLAAPILCSVVTRQSSLSTRVMALLCLGIVIGSIVLVAVLGVILRR